MQGSTFIRMKQLEKYWEGFKQYKYGENPDTLIFQKVYITPDWRFMEHFEGIKILDICDPDWLDGALVNETLLHMDAVTCPTPALADFLSQLTKKPIRVIPDRFDVEQVSKTQHSYNTTAKKVVWFGYSHNIEPMRPAIGLLKELGLGLIVIANDDPLFNRYIDDYKFIKYNEDTIYENLQLADFAILPVGNRPQDRFKSNNKTVKAILAGLPVAIDEETVRLYMSPTERQSFLDNNYAKIKKDYDIKLSVAEYQELINEIETQRNKA